MSHSTIIRHHDNYSRVFRCSNDHAELSSSVLTATHQCCGSLARDDGASCDFLTFPLALETIDPDRSSRKQRGFKQGCAFCCKNPYIRPLKGLGKFSHTISSLTLEVIQRENISYSSSEPNETDIVVDLYTGTT